MGTTYTLSPGYNSQYGKDAQEPWDALKVAAEAVTRDELLAEYQGPPSEDAEDDMMVCATDEGEKIVLRAAGMSRDIRERMCRAFIICVLKRTQGFDINVVAT